MAKNIFIASTKRNTGKSVVCLGLISALRGIVSNVGYFKPIGQRYKKNETFDKEAIMIKTLFNINDDLKYINPFSIEELNEFIMNDEGDVFFQKLQQSYKHIEKDKDIVIIDGIDNVGMISTFEFDINADIANNMAATVLLVEDGYMKSVDEIVSDASMGRDSFAEQASDFMGVIVNKVQNERFSEFEERLKSAFKKQNIEFFGAIPYDDILPKPRIYDIARCLEADILFGEKFLSNIAVEPLIASMEFENALKYITEGALIITGGDRNEILLGSFVSLLSPLYPNISGIILTGGLMPNETMIRLIKSMPEFSFPIISVKSNTLETTNRIKSLAVKVTSEDDQKIDIARTLIYKHIDFERINTILKVDRKKKRTPEIFKYEIIEKACSEKKRIVLPETGDERILRAVEKIRSQDIADIILLGDPDSIINKAVSIGVSLNDKIEIIDPLKSAKFENYMNTYLELRKHKNYTEDIARDMMQDSIYFGTMMIYKGDADGLVAGAVNTTRHTIKPAFEIIKTKQNISVASSVFLMCLKDMVILYGDCAINPNPNAEELAEIAISSVDTALAFDIEPFVAMLSYSTGESGKGPEVEMVKKATEIAKKRRPDIPIEGPIQYDAAIDPEVAKIKLPDSPVAGKATVFIFPDLNTGNNTYKAVQRSAGAIAIGPVIQGLNKPVNDLSRGCLVDDIVYTVAITAIQAQETKT